MPTDPNEWFNSRFSSDRSVPEVVPAPTFDPNDPVVPLKRSLDAVSHIKPETYREVSTLAEKQGLAPDAVSADVDEYRRRQKLLDMDLEDIAANYKATGDFLSNPANAAVAQDDVKSLKKLESGFRAIDLPWWEERIINPIVYGLKQGEEVVSTLLGEAGALSDDPIIKGIRATEQYREQQRYAPSLADEDILGKMSDPDSVGQFFSLLSRHPEVASNVLLTSVGTFLPVLAASAVGGPVSTAAVAGFGSLATEYSLTLSSTLKESGLDPSRAEDWAQAFQDDGLMRKARESGIKRGIAVGVFDAMTAGFAGKLLAGAKPGIVSPILRTTGETLVQAGGGMAGEATAQLVDEGEISALGDVLLEGILEMPTALVEAPANIAHYRRKAIEQAFGRHAELTLQSLSDQELVDRIVETANESTLYQESPDKYVEFLDSVAGEKQVFIPADIARQIPNAPAYITTQSDISNADVAISMKNFASEIATNEAIMEIIRPHITLRNDRLSMVDLETGSAVEVRRLIERAESEKEILDESSAIYEKVRSQLEGTGRQSQSTAKLSAKIIPEYVTAYVDRARTMGHEITPEQVYQKMGLSVQGPTVQRPDVVARGDVILDQKKPNFGDIMIDETRTIIETGEDVVISRKASDVYDEITARRTKINNMLDCLNA